MSGFTVTRPSKKARRALNRYLNGLLRTMHLSDWALTINWVEDESAAGVNGNYGSASIRPWYGRKGATITIPLTFLTEPPTEQRQTLVHELVHCHLFPPQDQVRCDLTKWLGQQAYDVMYDSFLRAMEYSVDGLADAIAPLVPLPELPRR